MELKIGFVVWGGCRIACPRRYFAQPCHCGTWLARDGQTQCRWMDAAAFHLAARPLELVFEEFSFLLALLATCEAPAL